MKHQNHMHNADAAKNPEGWHTPKAMTQPKPLNEVMAERITYEFLGESSGAHAGRLAEVCAAELKLLCEVVEAVAKMHEHEFGSCDCDDAGIVDPRCNALTALRKQLEVGK